MITHYQTATVFGGTGFIGRQIVRVLARQGFRIKVATRMPERAYFLKPSGTVGQIVPFLCDYNDPASIEDAVRGSDCVINCIGILHDKGKNNSFQKAHIDIPSAIAVACHRQGVQRLVHISVPGLSTNNSLYAQTKLTGEQAILEYFPDATVLQPSIVFGEDDNFFNKFARLAQFAPAFPLVGGGHTKFQPVYVGDVADAVATCLTMPETGDESPLGKTYALGGPDIVSFKDIYEIVFKYTNRHRMLVNIPFRLAKIKARFLEIMPNPLLTRDQVELLKGDNIVAAGARTFRDLRIVPKSMSTVLPTYLSLYRKGGRFA